MVIAGVDYMTYSAKAKGEPVDIVYPKAEQLLAHVQLGLWRIVKCWRCKRVYWLFIIRWCTKQVSKAYLLPGRTDIKAENRPNVEEIPVLNIDWKTVEKEQDEIGKQFKKVFQ